MNVNRVILGGNLTRDPEIRTTQGGKSLSKFGVAINSSYTSNGEKKQKTCFVDVVAWGRIAELIHKYLRKGDPIFIEGRLEFSQWTDSSTGQNRSKLEVTVEQFQFVGPKRSGESDIDREFEEGAPF